MYLGILVNLEVDNGMIFKYCFKCYVNFFFF